MTPAEKAWIEAWYEKADHDLLSVQRLLEIEPYILDTACFHCQQAAEKYLKAFLIYHKVEFERVHDLDLLLELCSDYDKVFHQVDTMKLSDFAVQIRYPANAKMPELAQAQSYYQLALGIKAMVVARVDLTVRQELQPLPDATLDILKTIQEKEQHGPALKLGNNQSKKR